jgi:glyoxylase-like metal-dependent hydrolase (beta-lactamase superfamily II)
MFTPGHTKGHVSILYKPSRVLFTGDHLTFTKERTQAAGGGHLYLLRELLEDAIYDAQMQCDYVDELVGVDFVHILPGHECSFSLASVEEKDEALKDLTRFERTRPNGSVKTQRSTTEGIIPEMMHLNML